MSDNPAVMPPGIAYVLFGGWRSGDSGVDTFVRHLEPLFNDGVVHGALVEIPYKEVDCRAAESLPAPHAVGSAAVQVPEPATWRLLVGYLLRVLHDVRILWPLRKALRGRVLLTNQFGCETLPLALRVLCPRSPMISICHTHAPTSTTGRERVRRFVERLNYRAADQVIYNSHSVRHEWRKRLDLQRIKGNVIWYGIDPPDESLPDDYPARPVGAVDFVCVSRFVRWKGHQELITAFAQAAEQTAVPSRLILVGDGSERGPAIAHAASLGLSVVDLSQGDRNPPILQSSDSPVPHAPVFFLGSRPNAARYFNAADVAVQLSIEPEAFGIVLLEAMSRKKPVIASGIGGILEVVQDGHTGLLVNPTDMKAATNAMVDLAQDTHERNEMGQAGYKRWCDLFTVERMQADYVRVLSRVT